ncbi:MAG: immunoglobulin domain-containing protein [Planctomycetes bacterium]|nr:immunoglobulin domain-containing protein [Planctomycetota bacterium]
MPFQLGLSQLIDSRWQLAGKSIAGNVHALAIFDDGAGPALIAAGAFQRVDDRPIANIVKWDGELWHSLGAGLTGELSSPAVSALAVFPTPTGSILVAGGSFHSADGTFVNCVAAWNGRTWSSLGTGMTGYGSETRVSALFVHDDGNGPVLIAGGRFQIAGGIPAGNIAFWNGTSWNALGTGTNGAVSALGSYYDGDRRRLVAGGEFTEAGGLPAIRVASWDGGNWQAMGLGLGDPSYSLQSVRGFIEHDDGLCHRLVACGQFYRVRDTYSVDSVAVWDGTDWDRLFDQKKRNGLGSSYSGNVMQCLAVMDPDGSGPLPTSLYAGGYLEYFYSPADPDRPISGITKWTKEGWVALDDGVQFGGFYGVNVRAMLPMDDDGAGPDPTRLYVAGAFAQAGQVAAANVAQWDDTSQQWQALGVGVNEMARALCEWDRGDGSALYVGGHFTTAGGSDAAYIASWNPRTHMWSPLDSEMNGQVNAIASFDDGSGPALYVGGRFSKAGGFECNGIARWDGITWSPVGGGVGGTYPFVYCLKVYDDGAGPALYAGGMFSSAGGIPASFVAKWDGSKWSAVGGGIAGHYSSNSAGVFSLTDFDDGDGPALIAHGSFLAADGKPAKCLAKWNGKSWSEVGGGLTALSPSESLSYTRGLISFDDGTGPSLWVAGQFRDAGNQRSDNIAVYQPAGPTIEAHPHDFSTCAGGQAVFTVKAVGVAPLTYQWRRHNEPLHDGSTIDGASTSTLSITSASFQDAGVYDVVVADARGQVTSYPVQLFVFDPNRDYSVEPQTITSCPGGLAEFTVEPPGLAPASYQWRRNGIPIAGATQRVLRFDPVAWENAATYDVVVADSCAVQIGRSAELVVNATMPTISEQPVSRTTCPGSTTTFTVSAFGSPPFSYQWRKDGVNIPNAISASFTIATVDAGSQGDYDVDVSDRCGAIRSTIARLTVAPVTPAIVTEPGDLHKCPGTAAIFSVYVQGVPPIRYQWYKDGFQLSGASSNVLFVDPVTTTSAGEYVVEVRDQCGMVRSRTAMLTIGGPVLSSQPGTTYVCPAGDASMSVEANGVGALTYRWHRNNQPLVESEVFQGVSTPTLTIRHCTLAEQGYYNVSVTDSQCPTWSTQAALFLSGGGSGDGTGDGLCDTDDIPFFAAELLRTDGSNGNCEFDMDYNEIVDGRDIQWFIYLMIGY